MLLHLCTSVWFRFASSFSFRFFHSSTLSLGAKDRVERENMSELCIFQGADRKYCSVIQGDISLFKQHFPLFPLSWRTPKRRQPTALHIRLQYCRIRTPRKGLRNIMKVSCCEPRRSRHVVSEQIKFLSFPLADRREDSFDYKFMRNELETAEAKTFPFRFSRSRLRK
jgi:hypothetical protein